MRQQVKQQLKQQEQSCSLLTVLFFISALVFSTLAAAGSVFFSSQYEIKLDSVVVARMTRLVLEDRYRFILFQRGQLPEDILPWSGSESESGSESGSESESESESESVRGLDIRQMFLMIQTIRSLHRHAGAVPGIINFLETCLLRPEEGSTLSNTIFGTTREGDDQSSSSNRSSEFQRSMEEQAASCTQMERITDSQRHCLEENPHIFMFAECMENTFTQLVEKYDLCAEESDRARTIYTYASRFIFNVISNPLASEQMTGSHYGLNYDGVNREIIAIGEEVLEGLAVRMRFTIDENNMIDSITMAAPGIAIEFNALVASDVSTSGQPVHTPSENNENQDCLPQLPQLPQVRHRNGFTFFDSF